MDGNSSIVITNQDGVHPNLERIVERHLRESFLKTPSAHTRIVFEETLRKNSLDRYPLIFDLCCGTGQSTRQIAHSNSDCLVVGIDKSSVRIRKGLLSNEMLPENCILLRADYQDFLLLAVQHRLRCKAQYLLYPNPYPKKRSFQERWYGHASFAAVVALGGKIEFCTNWSLGACEAFLALKQAGATELQLEQLKLASGGARTSFERKYSRSGHVLWQVTGVLSSKLNVK